MGTEGGLDKLVTPKLKGRYSRKNFFFGRGSLFLIGLELGTKDTDIGGGRPKDLSTSLDGTENTSVSWHIQRLAQL